MKTILVFFFKEILIRNSIIIIIFIYMYSNYCIITVAITKPQIEIQLSPTFLFKCQHIFRLYKHYKALIIFF